MPSTHTIVIGAGQAGLAVSRCLTDAGVDHVVLERGRIAERWRSRALGLAAAAHPELGDPAPGLALPRPRPRRLHDRRRARRATSRPTPARSPRRSRTTATVRAVAARRRGFVVRTDAATWHGANVVIATGGATAARPGVAGRLDPAIAQVTTEHLPPPRPPARRRRARRRRVGHRRPARRRARPRRPRRRARRRPPQPRCPAATAAWTSAGGSTSIGTFATTIDDVRDPPRARPRAPLQLVGRATTATSTSPRCNALGVRLAGRLTGDRRRPVRFADDLAHRRRRRRAPRAACSTRSTPLRRHRARRRGARRRRAPPGAAAPPRHALDLRAARHQRRRLGDRLPAGLPVAAVPVLDEHGEIVQRRGVTPAPGLYVVGLRFQHRRDSNFIDGVRHDAAFVARHIAAHRRQRRRPSADQGD